ncbi:MAG: M24 family metallopeptidase [Pseudomonadota bacterium]
MDPRLEAVANEVRVDLASTAHTVAIAVAPMEYDAVSAALAGSGITIRQRGREPLTHWLSQNAQPGAAVALCPDGLTATQACAIRAHLTERGFRPAISKATKVRQRRFASWLARRSSHVAAFLAAVAQDAPQLLTAGYWAGFVTGLRDLDGGAPDAWLLLRSGRNAPFVLTENDLPGDLICDLRARGIGHARRISLPNLTKDCGIDPKISPARAPLLLENPVREVTAPRWKDSSRSDDISMDVEARCLNAAFDCAVIEILAAADQGAFKSEIELRDALAARFAQCAGFRGMAFPIYVAAGQRAAMPHPVPSATPTALNGPVLIDAGIHGETLTTDMSRTLLPAGASPEIRVSYTRVLKALARASMAAGPETIAAQTAALDVLHQGGVKMPHGLGHTVLPGLDVHGPEPVFGHRTATLASGCFFTLEPAIYTPGEFGVRLENLLQINLGKADTLTYIPLDTRQVCAALITDDEKTWLKRYNAQTLARRAAMLSHAAVNWCLRASTWPGYGDNV